MTFKSLWKLFFVFLSLDPVLAQNAPEVKKTSDFIMNGSFERAEKGYKFETHMPEGKLQSVISFSEKVHGNGNKSLKFNVSPETAQLGVFTQRIHINTLKSAKSLRLKARIFIETPENKDKKYGGIFSLRLRQWGKGAYLRDALKIYCSFDADKIRIIEKKDRRTYPRVINDYMNKWIEIESTAPVDEDARALDILCSARGNPKAVLYLDEISIEELVLPVINILQMPKAIKTGREIIPVKADVAVPANQSAIMKFNANNEVEKWSYSKDFKLSNGVQTFELPIKGIPPGKIALKFTVINSDGNILQTITEKIDCLEDPFVD